MINHLLFTINHSLLIIKKMAKQQPQQPQKRQTPAPATTPVQPRKTPAPVRATVKKESLFNVGSNELIYGKNNFIWMGLGLALVVAGLVAMSGGAMPSPDVWDENIIYSFRRITLAPIMMVAGFIITLIGIFKKNDNENTTNIAITEEN
jgi:hypothetical protein